MPSRNGSAFSSTEVALSAFFAAAYAAGVITLLPYSFLPFQVRIADALLPLSMIFGLPAVVGLTMGCFVANFFGGLGMIDVIGGSIANFAATYLAWKIGRDASRSRQFVSTMIETGIVALVVGSYLWYLFGMPSTDTVAVANVQLPGLLAMWANVLFGSLVAINLIGFLLLEAVSKSIRSQQISSR